MRIKHKIGFTKKYYTLWCVVEGKDYKVFSYIQNLSMSQGKAVAKFQKLYPSENPDIDYALCGLTFFNVKPTSKELRLKTLI